MTVDAHTHVMKYHFLRFDWFELERWLGKTNKCIVMPKIRQNEDSVDVNVRFFDQVKGFSKRSQIFPFMWIHPHQLREEHFRRFPTAGFKFHPSISQSPIHENREMLDMCAKYRKPILIHCGRNMMSRIDFILQVNEEYPEVKFVCAHMGGLATELIIRAFRRLMVAKIDNIFLETSGCDLSQLIEKAVELFGSEKVVFGTDRPFKSYEVSRYIIDCCKFGRKIKIDVLRNNVLKVLGENNG